LGTVTPCRWATDHSPIKTIQHQLSPGNTEGGTWVAALWSGAVALGSRSSGLGGMVEEPRARFHVPEWGVFCHLRILQIHPARFNRV